MDDSRYVSPLASRNASAAMQAIWSPGFKFKTWRRLWAELAAAQRELGLNVSQEQVDALRQAVDLPIDYQRAAVLERELRHDVMAHVHLLGEAVPVARPVIHLGATSQFVVCNSELIMIREALQLVAQKLASAILRLGHFAKQYRDLPTLGYTHLQPAQPTTVGKRATLWAHDLMLGLEEIEARIDRLRFRGVKGTTGTQASFLKLFKGHHDHVEQLDVAVTEAMGWASDRRFIVTGQTYPRVVDAMVLSALAGVAAAASKFGADLRLLASRKEIEEPFGAAQIGSSAMPYKRNPMKSERICGLSRFVIGMVSTPYTTAAEQWMERTLDDSSCRRLTLPEPFLALDGVLDLLVEVSSGMVVYPTRVAANLAAELPFMASENVLMAAVDAGGDRQVLHEAIRQHSVEAGREVKEHAKPNDLLDRLAGDERFAGIDVYAESDPSKFVGRAPEQVDRFLQDAIEPIAKRYPNAATYQAATRV